MIKIYEYLQKHVGIRRISLLVITTVLIALISRLSYKEDISDFLPLGSAEKEAMSVYQDISGANKLIVMFDNPGDEGRVVTAIERFIEIYDSIQAGTAEVSINLEASFDLSKLESISSFVYAHIPLFLTEEDYKRMDSSLAKPDYIEEQLEEDRQLLMFPTSSLLSKNLSYDPLNLFTPVLTRLQGTHQASKFEVYDGYIFTPDMSKAIVMLTSPYGNSETENNAKLIGILENAIQKMQVDYPDIKAHVTGGPQIAVGNASQIKKDSILAISLSIILILLLLFYSSHSSRNIMLIALTIGWGWLFAMGGMALFRDSVSIIVIGISSVILGIAVNYPLHLVAHLQHEPDLRQCLKDITTPLVIGNITTVGAFMALVPLRSTALRDLGLFASLLLAGTIVFVLLYLPHMVRTNEKDKKQATLSLIDKIAKWKPENSRALVIIVALLTIIFGFFALDTSFDSNMANINYMSKQQRSDMAYFQSIMQGDSSGNIETATPIYILSTASTLDSALAISASRKKIIDSLQNAGIVISHQGVHPFITSRAEQEKRTEMWKVFTSKHKDSLTQGLREASMKHGFASDAFDSFYEIVDKENISKWDFESQDSPVNSLFAPYMSISDTDNRYSVVDVLQVSSGHTEDVATTIPDAFDIKSLNSSIANTLSDDFNYIGWACSLIVFFFLWFSFRRIELAVISFLPMAISWIWILGIMSILGIKFNIVNIILATFIFGQGDDYTIFITEGCISEYVHKKPVLESYKSSILQSALIMFIGIGTLIVAQHPALRSLAEVTIIGMASVVFMAWFIPPLLFKWIMKNKE